MNFSAAAFSENDFEISTSFKNEDFFNTKTFSVYGDKKTVYGTTAAGFYIHSLRMSICLSLHISVFIIILLQALHSRFL